MFIWAFQIFVKLMVQCFGKIYSLDSCMYIQIMFFCLNVIFLNAIFVIRHFQYKGKIIQERCLIISCVNLVRKETGFS